MTAGQLQYGAFDSSWGAVHERLRAAHSHKQWPTVDILLCHYVEPVTHSMQTLKNCLSLQYASELLLHVFVLDDGYTKYVWDANNHFKVTVNTKAIEICGDLRGDLAR